MSDDQKQPHRSPLQVKGFAPKVSAQQVHETIIASIRAAGDRALRWVPFDVAATPEMIDLRRDIAEAELKVEQLARAADQLYEDINRRDDNGAYVNTDEAARRLNVELDSKAQARDEATGTMQRLKADLESAVVRARMDSQVLAVDALFDVLERLSDPYDLTYQHLMHQSLHDPVFDTTPFHLLGRKAWDVHFRAELRAGSGSGLVVLPVEGHWQEGVALQVHEHRLALIEELIEGRPIIESRVRWRPTLQRDLAELLDADLTTVSWLVHCSDPRILRTAIACRFRRAGRSNEELSRELGEPVDFVEAVDRTWSAPRGYWTASRRPPEIAACYLDALDNGGRLTSPELTTWLTRNGFASRYPERRLVRDSSGRLYLTACQCGSRAAALLRFREAYGAICLDCRQDAHGVVWAATPYDYYITGRKMYEARGLVDPTTAQLPDVMRPRGGLYTDGRKGVQQ